MILPLGGVLNDLINVGNEKEMTKIVK